MRSPPKPSIHKLSLGHCSQCWNRLRLWRGILLWHSVLLCHCIIPSDSWAAIASADSPGAQIPSFTEQPCSPGETWTWKAPHLPSPIRTEWIHELEGFLRGQTSTIRSFSEAYALRQLSTSSEETALSEYWISRTLYHAGLIHLAQRGFNSLLSRHPSSEIVGFQLAALGCISKIRQKYPSIDMNERVASNIPAIKEQIAQTGLQTQSIKKLLWEAAFSICSDLLHPQFHQVLPVLHGSGPYESFCMALISAAKNLHSQTIHWIQTFIAESQGIPFFQPYQNQAYLLYGRALYTSGHFIEAIQAYKQINVRSNEWVHALSELSWAFLSAGQYRESIGAGISLQSGNFKKTFAPESLMVMAISLNEICQFPEALDVIQTYRGNYKDSYIWLKEATRGNLSQKTPPSSLYHLAVAYAKNSKTSSTPSRIASEWIRSPIFLSHQDRINLLFKESQLTSQLSKQGKNEQRTIKLALLAQARELKKRFQREQIKLGESDHLSPELMRDINGLRDLFLHFHRMKKAAAIWRRMLSHNEETVPSVQNRMVSEINRELARLNSRMLSQLEEIEENNELIEVEIFNGASEDIIWQNAHPDYKEFSRKIETASAPSQGEKVWDWGTTTGGLNGRSEIWEDELGSLSANMHDNCENKNKYLEVKRTNR